MEEFVKFAIAKGVIKYGFSSHAPLPFHTSWNMNLDDFLYYVKEFFRLKEKYAESIDLYLGLETDYIEGVFNAKSALYDTSDLHYMIGSVHYLDPLPDGGFFSVDGKFFNFTKNMDAIYGGEIRRASKRFFDISSRMVERGGFDVVGHLDKIAQNGRNCSGFDIGSDWYVGLMTDYLHLIKEKDLLIEINTKSFAELGITYPDVSFFPLVKDMKIPVMVNSDCHYPDKVLDSFEPVYKSLKNAGIHSVVQLSDSGWEEVGIESN